MRERERDVGGVLLVDNIRCNLVTEFEHQRQLLPQEKIMQLSHFSSWQ